MERKNYKQTENIDKEDKRDMKDYTVTGEEK